VTDEDTPAFYHCSSHGVVLLHIAANPHSTISNIAEALCLTPRTVWGIVGVLRRTKQVRVETIGRTNHYYVNMDAPFFHPTVKGLRLKTLGQFLISRQPQFAGIG
jgi:hypothetical protein